MKTIEEKAKAYDEAMERAKHVKLTDTKENVAAAEYIFPELKESEDERHRKWILEYLYDGLRKADEQFKDHFKSAIDWLEKQKEQKPSEKQDYSSLTDFERAIHRGFLCAGVENVPVTIIKETAQECMSKFKPAEWSEEDDVMFNTAKKIIWESEASEGTTNKVISWLGGKLRSLLHQPKQEWSEEDDRILAGIIGKIDHDQSYGVSKDDMLRLLKSIPSRILYAKEQ